jgi:hypothetical protein
VTTAGGQVKYRQVQLEVVTPEALILGKEEYHIQQGGSLLTTIAYSYSPLILGQDEYCTIYNVTPPLQIHCK